MVHYSQSRFRISENITSGSSVSRANGGMDIYTISHWSMTSNVTSKFVLVAQSRRPMATLQYQQLHLRPRCRYTAANSLGGLVILTETARPCFGSVFRRLQLCNMTSKSKIKLNIFLVLEKNNIEVYYNRKYYFIK